MELEVHFSGNSNSTQNSNLAQTKPKLQIDTESLEAQIDRLNYNLLGFLKTDDKEIGDSFSYQACSDYFKKEPCDSFSYQASEFFHNDDDLVYKTDPRIERKSMITEDFRGHEQRCIASVKGSFLECRLTDLYLLKSQISEAIESVEKGLSLTVSIKLGELELVLKKLNQSSDIFQVSQQINCRFLDEIAAKSKQNENLLVQLKSLETINTKIHKENENLKISSAQLTSAVALLKQELNSMRSQENSKDPLGISIPMTCPTPKAASGPSEIENLEQEIAELQAKLKISPDENAIKFKINHLHNKLSALKSSRVLNSPSVKRLNTFLKTSSSNLPTPQSNSRPLKVFNFDNMNVSIPSTPKVGNYARNLFLASPKEALTQNNVAVKVGYDSNKEFLGKEEYLTRLLEMKDLRLKKKEEEINKRELNLQKTWMRVPNANEFIPMLQNELFAYVNRNQVLEKQQKEMDSIIRENIEAKKRIYKLEKDSAKVHKELQAKLSDFLQKVDEH